MKLVPVKSDSEDLGLWNDPSWKSGTPATFAVIIGVSSYPHLKGGTDPTDARGTPWIAEASELDQLNVSALTAYRMFSWLAEQYRHDAPLARCWLLLSPTVKEQGLLTLPDGSPAYWGTPTLNNCDAAIRWWFQTMEALPVAAASQSRGLFFFSGHGLESTQERQLLLPSDYLARPAPNINAAISTSNLRYGLGALKVNQQLFFVDACRNDQKELRGMQMIGSSILVEQGTWALSRDLVTPVLYSTGPGQRSWEFRDPAKGISIYGQALLDGLRGTPNIEIKGSNPNRRIELSPLEQYVRNRVLQLMIAAKSKERQVVKLGGQIDTSMTVTYVDHRSPFAGHTPRTIKVSADLEVTTQQYRDSGRDLRFYRRPDGSIGFDVFPIGEIPEAVDDRPAAEPLPSPSSEALAAETPIRNRSATGRPSNEWLENETESHRLFGSENFTELWKKRTAIWLHGSRKWCGPEAIRIVEVAHDEYRDRYRVSLQIVANENVGYWLQMIDEEGTAHSCMLPRDVSIDGKGRNPVYELLIDRSPSKDVRRITRLEAHLGNKSGPLSYAVATWRRYKTEHVAAAVKESESKALRAVIEKKIESPLAAIIASLVLLRANRLDRVPQRWLRNLARWFPQLPDGAILFAELRLREKPATKEEAGRAVREAALYLSMVLDRGIPCTSEAFDYAVSLVGRLKEAKELAAPVRERLKKLDYCLNNVFGFYRTGGLFTAFSGLPAELPPEQLWQGGLPQAKPDSAIEEVPA
jgi:Caspase domain